MSSENLEIDVSFAHRHTQNRNPTIDFCVRYDMLLLFWVASVICYWSNEREEKKRKICWIHTCCFLLKYYERERRKKNISTCVVEVQLDLKSIDKKTFRSWQQDNLIEVNSFLREFVCFSIDSILLIVSASNPHEFLRFNILNFQIHHNQSINLIHLKTQVELKEINRSIQDPTDSTSQWKSTFSWFFRFQDQQKWNFRCTMKKINVLYSMLVFWIESNDKWLFACISIISSMSSNRI